MPDNALTRKLLTEHNNILPNPLKMKVERIAAYKPVPAHAEEKGTEVLTLKNIELETEVEKLRAQLAEALESKPTTPQNVGATASSNGNIKEEPVKETASVEKNKK